MWMCCALYIYCYIKYFYVLTTKCFSAKDTIDTTVQEASKLKHLICDIVTKIYSVLQIPDSFVRLIIRILRLGLNN